MKILFFTGAGVSAESGLETFRGSTGLWKNHDTDLVCNFENWRENYDLVHEFYNGRRQEIVAAQPNAFHEAVAQWSKEHDVANVTQNIDDLFEKAGCHNVIHVHGFYQDMKCHDCDHIFPSKGDWSADAPCPNCASMRSVKPGVVFFNEPAPRYLDLFQQLHDVSEDGDGMIVVAGTSEQVLPISRMIHSECRQWSLDTHKMERGTYNVLVNEKPLGFAMGHEVYHEAIEKRATDAVVHLKEIITRLAN